MKNKFFIGLLTFVFFGTILSKNLDCKDFTDDQACFKNQKQGCKWDVVLKKCYKVS